MFFAQAAFLLTDGGGAAMSSIGITMLLFTGLYVEMVAAIAVMFFGGVLLFALIMAPRFIWGRHLSSAEQRREIQKFRRRFLERSL
jgi:hypothetical protein